MNAVTAVRYLFAVTLEERQRRKPKENVNGMAVANHQVLPSPYDIDKNFWISNFLLSGARKQVLIGQ
jgi:hypothetical protein